MILKLDRKYKKDKYTIGNLYIDGVWFSNTMEDKDRGLSDSMSEGEINSIKVYGETAIPTGEYIIDMDTISPKFSTYSFYKKICNGKLPRLKNVKGFSGILIHVADGYSGSKLVKGCIGVGYNKIKGGLLDGKKVFSELYNRLLNAKLKGEEIVIQIQ